MELKKRKEWRRRYFLGSGSHAPSAQRKDVLSTEPRATWRENRDSFHLLHLSVLPILFLTLLRHNVENNLVLNYTIGQEIGETGPLTFASQAVHTLLACPSQRAPEATRDPSPLAS